MDDRSDADAALKRLQRIIQEERIFSADSPRLSEDDVKAKLIDPLFREVLGWRESEIRRERSAGHGLADYVFGNDYAWLHVEAKRTRPRFKLNAPTTARRINLSGPHLLGKKEMRQWVEQAQRYSSELGSQFVVLTNGSQYILWNCFSPGKPWRDGVALVWHGLSDIEAHFAEFFGLLSRDAVCSGKLIEAFQGVVGLTQPRHTPLDYIEDPDRVLLRNPLWAKMSRVLAPLFSSTGSDRGIQEEVIRHCYVTTPISDDTDRNLDALIRDTPPQYLQDARAVDLRPHGGRTTAMHARMEGDVKAHRPSTYILTGGVGSGKTTFLVRFAQIVQPAFVSEYCVWVHVDFLHIGNAAAADFDREIRLYTYAKIRSELKDQYPDNQPTTGDHIRELFDDELVAARLTRLHGLDPTSSEYQIAENEIVHDLFNDDQAFCRAQLRRLSRSGRRVVIVLDNTDQLGETFQEAVFLLSQRLTEEFRAVTIVALREERFFAAYRRGLFDAYGDSRFHIGSPNLRDVLRERLEYGRAKLKADLSEDPSVSTEEARKIHLLLGAVIRSATDVNANIVRMLSCVSNGDIRNALDMFREFLSSGNTDINKIASIGASYRVPFHEFAKSAILGGRRFYRSSTSHVVNVFVRSGAPNSSHLAGCRVLARLCASEGIPSQHGEGFVAPDDLLREYRASFGLADDVIVHASELLRRGLIESEPPKVVDIRAADAIRVTAAGAYYWRYLVRSFAYLDLVFVDTPVDDRELAKTLASLATLRDMSARFERVRKFLEYLSEQEARELSHARAQLGPYRTELIGEIVEQLEKELSVVSRKLRLTRRK